MKKMLIAMQIVILLLVLVKVGSLFGIFKKVEMIPGVALLTTQAMAQPPATPVAPAAATPVAASSPVQTPSLQVAKDPMEESLGKQRDLASALIARKIELDNRENNMRVEEQRLLALRKEITDKINILKAQEDKLTLALDSGQAADAKRFKEMAKVYEATPPIKAGPMLEKLDLKTAAGITMNMKKDKAGAIWAYITPQKAVDITREITRAGGFKAD